MLIQIIIRQYVSLLVTCFERAMPNAESTSRVSPRVYKFFLSKQHKKMSKQQLDDTDQETLVKHLRKQRKRLVLKRR